ncbi:hypothetical protein RIEGSTA812A_PEG_317 [invertebrate metagenome]|uniref:Uncharacterized protein n=1 Tax=invertebrate metagenome TaxID=1711999 RepID=A0A484H5S8_9ZZZZ
MAREKPTAPPSLSVITEGFAAFLSGGSPLLLCDFTTPMWYNAVF